MAIRISRKIKRRFFKFIIFFIILLGVLHHLGDMTPNPKDYILSKEEYEKVFKEAKEDNMTTMLKIRDHYLFLGEKVKAFYWENRGNRLWDLRNKKRELEKSPYDTNRSK